MRKPDPNIKLRKVVKIAKDYTDESEKKSQQYTDKKISEVIERIPELPEPVEIPELDMDEVAAGVIARMPKPGKKRKKKKELELAEVMSIVTDAIAGIQTEYKKTGDTIIVQQAPQTIIEKIKETVTTERVDYEAIYEYVNGMFEPLRIPVQAYGGTNTIRGLTDVVLDDLEQDQYGNYILGSAGFAENFETLNKNLKIYDFNYYKTDGKITSIVYDLPDGESITKTIVRDLGKIVSVYFTGDLPDGMIKIAKNRVFLTATKTYVYYSDTPLSPSNFVFESGDNFIYESGDNFVYN